jgi:HD-GYP domain-containing protein (c-di-GMP phosphodiesterase class II)
MIDTVEIFLNCVQNENHYRSFKELGFKNMKKEAADKLVEHYKNGTISTEAQRSLIEYYADEIKNKKRMTIDDVPDEIIYLVQEKL